MSVRVISVEVNVLQIFACFCEDAQKEVTNRVPATLTGELSGIEDVVISLLYFASPPHLIQCLLYPRSLLSDVLFSHYNSMSLFIFPVAFAKYLKIIFFLSRRPNQYIFLLTDPLWLILWCTHPLSCPFFHSINRLIFAT